MILFSSLVLSLEVMIPGLLSLFHLDSLWTFVVTTAPHQEEEIYQVE